MENIFKKDFAIKCNEDNVMQILQNLERERILSWSDGCCPTRIMIHPVLELDKNVLLYIKKTNKLVLTREKDCACKIIKAIDFLFPNRIKNPTTAQENFAKEKLHKKVDREDIDNNHADIVKLKERVEVLEAKVEHLRGKTQEGFEIIRKQLLKVQSQGVSNLRRVERLEQAGLHLIAIK